MGLVVLIDTHGIDLLKGLLPGAELKILGGKNPTHVGDIEGQWRSVLHPSLGHLALEGSFMGLTVEFGDPLPVVDLQTLGSLNDNRLESF